MEKNDLALRPERENNISTFLKSFFDIEYSRHPFFFDNLETFRTLSVYFINHLEPFILKVKRPIDFEKVEHEGISSKLDLLQRFYNYLGINYDISNLVTNGSLNIETIPLEKAVSKKIIFNGFCGIKKNNHLSLDVYNTDLVLDLFVWIHEITHYRNMNFPINEANDLLTEALSFTYELLMLDYLSAEGYFYESATYQYEFLRNTYAFIYNAYFTIKMYYLYFQTGEVNIDTYRSVYGYDDDYDECLKIFLKNIKKDENCIFTHIKYLLGYLLAIHMYIEYEKDSNYIHTIEELNSRIQTSTFEDSLGLIGITDFDETNINKLIKSLSEFKAEILLGNDHILGKVAVTNDYIIELLRLFYEEKHIVFNHIEESYQLVDFLIKELKPYFKEHIPYPEINRFTKCGREEKKSIIKDFYRFLNRDATIVDIFDQAKITSFNPEEGIDPNGDCTLLMRASLTGYVTNEDGEKEIGLTETNLLLDSCAWVHELKHYHNLPETLRSSESYILTEAVSFTEELIYADFLSKIGYNYDGAFIKYETLNNFYIFCLDSYPIQKLVTVFKAKGEVSKPKYQALFGQDDDFERTLDEAQTLLTEDADDFKNGIRYAIACALSIYMYTEYKKDPSFIHKIDEFESRINDTPFYECLKIIGLTGLDEDSLSKVTKAFKEYENELNSFIKSGILKLYNMKNEKVL